MKRKYTRQLFPEKKIGRSHLEKDIYENIDRLKLAGFDNISIDLIYALPGQTTF